MLLSEILYYKGWVITLVADYPGDLIIPKVDVKEYYWLLICVYRLCYLHHGCATWGARRVLVACTEVMYYRSLNGLCLQVISEGETALNSDGEKCRFLRGW